jgi:hypothetical protein
MKTKTINTPNFRVKIEANGVVVRSKKHGDVVVIDDSMPDHIVIDGWSEGYFDPDEIPKVYKPKGKSWHLIG